SQAGRLSGMAWNLLNDNTAQSVCALPGTKRTEKNREEQMETKTRPAVEKTLGQILVEKGIINRDQLDRALKIKSEQPDKYLGEILFEIGVSQEKINRALYYSNKRKTIGEILVDQKLITREQLDEALS